MLSVVGGAVLLAWAEGLLHSLLSDIYCTHCAVDWKVGSYCPLVHSPMSHEVSPSSSGVVLCHQQVATSLCAVMKTCAMVS